MDIVTQIQQKFTNPYDKPTDIIGLTETGRTIANSLLAIINPKEICFFDEQIKSDSTFHYLDFSDMLAKTEIMIFTVELSESYYQYLARLNPEVTIFIFKELQNTIKALREAGFEQNLVLL
jgi:hypothetical protein